MKLPKVVFARIVKGDSAPWLSAETSLEKALGDEIGPETIGVYKLVETKRVRRVLTVEQTAR